MSLWETIFNNKNTKKIKKTILTIALLAISTSAFASSGQMGRSAAMDAETAQVSAEGDNASTKEKLHQDGNIEVEKQEVGISVTKQKV